MCHWLSQKFSYCVTILLHTNLKCALCSRGYGTATAGSGDESEGNTEDIIGYLHAQGNHKGVGSSHMKKPIELDVEGQPWGSMKDAFQKDVQKYAKDLDPSCGWEGQDKSLRRHLFKRLYSGESFATSFSFPNS